MGLDGFEAGVSPGARGGAEEGSAGAEEGTFPASELSALGSRVWGEEGEATAMVATFLEEDGEQIGRRADAGIEREGFLLLSPHGSTQLALELWVVRIRKQMSVVRIRSPNSNITYGE